MRKRGLYCGPVSVCPSVCLTRLCIRVPVHSTQTAEDIVRHLCGPGSPIILVFLTPGADTQFQGGRGAKYKGVGKFCDFRLKSPPISETVRDRPIVAMER